MAESHLLKLHHLKVWKHSVHPELRSDSAFSFSSLVCFFLSSPPQLCWLVNILSIKLCESMFVEWGYYLKETFYAFSFLPALHCVINCMFLCKVEKVEVHTKSSSLPQKTLFLKRPISSLTIGPVTLWHHNVTMSHICIIYALLLVWHVKCIKHSCSVDVSSAISGVFELTNQSRREDVWEEGP